MTSRPLRLGIALLSSGSLRDLVEGARIAAGIGFDVILVPDHLGFPSPLITLSAIAATVPRVRVGSCVLNTGFYRPALLARDLIAVDANTDGRLEIGLGAGDIAQEFATAGLPFLSGGQRVQHLADHIAEINAAFTDPPHSLPRPPIMVAGKGDKLLAMAAQNADIVSIMTLGTEADVPERVEYIKHKAGARFDEIELAFCFAQVSLDDPTDMRIIQMYAPETSAAQGRELAAVLVGPNAEAADRIRRLQETLGISYFQITYVINSTSTSWKSLEQLVAAVKK